MNHKVLSLEAIWTTKFYPWKQYEPQSFISDLELTFVDILLKKELFQRITSM